MSFSEVFSFGKKFQTENLCFRIPLIEFFFMRTVEEILQQFILAVISTQIYLYGNSKFREN